LCTDEQISNAKLGLLYAFFASYLIFYTLLSKKKPVRIEQLPHIW